MEKSAVDLSKHDRLPPEEITIGSRQTVDVVEIDGVRGKLVWRNGPAMFMPLHGYDTIAYRVRADEGGASSTEGSWRRVWFGGGPELRAKLIERGENHARFFSSAFGDGWMVTEPKLYMRFETMDGVVRVRFEMVAAGVGRPDYYQKMIRSKSRMPEMKDPDEKNWLTYVSRSGDMFAFRRGGTPPEPETEHTAHPEQLDLKL